MRMSLVSFLAVFIFVIFNQSLFAKTLVVADIDDTLKISHILDVEDALTYGVQTENAFTGMNQLFDLMKSGWGSEVDFYYLSNAPAWLMEDLHRDFLNLHSFPSGRLSLLDSYSDRNTHKLNKIRLALKGGQYERIFLFGDNGEKDSVVYDQIRKEFRNLQIIVFIHQLYSHQNGGGKLLEDQMGYVTPVEILLELSQRKIMKNSEVEFLIQTLSEEIIHEGLIYSTGIISFPLWKDCRDFQWKWDLPGHFPRFVLERCSQKPRELELWNLF